MSFVLILVYCWSICGLSQRAPCVPDNTPLAFEYLTGDSVRLEVYECRDPVGTLDGYTAHINTPVCEDRICYDAELDFYWDILGNFSHFAVDPDKPLTKKDHVPFEPSDYMQLKKILLTRSPSFIHLRRAELITKPIDGDTASADAMTGATAREVKKDMVEGAVFTCYTLWHIANGGITFEIEQHTREQLDEKLIRTLLDTEEAAAHYFLVEHIGPKYFPLFLQELLLLAEKYDAFFTDRLLRNMPAHLLEEGIVQQFIVRQFDRMEYATQEALLHKLEDGLRLNPSTLEYLAGQAQTGNTARSDQIVRLLCDQTGPDQTAVLAKLMDVLLERQTALSPGSLELLLSVADRHPSLKDKVRRLSRKDAQSLGK